MLTVNSIVVKIAILIVGSYDPTILHTKNDQDLNKIVIRVGSYQDRRIARRIVGSDRRIVGSPSYLFFCFLIFFFYINLLSISPCLKAQWLRILHESYYFDVVNWLSFARLMSDKSLCFYGLFRNILHVSFLVSCFITCQKLVIEVNHMDTWSNFVHNLFYVSYKSMNYMLKIFSNIIRIS